MFNHITNKFWYELKKKKKDKTFSAEVRKKLFKYKQFLL